MRSSRPVICLLACAMAVLFVLVPRIAGAQNREIVLPLTFNEVPKGEVPVILQGDDVFVRPSDLEGAGANSAMWRRLLAFARLQSGARKSVTGAEYISLKSLGPYLSFKFDESTLALAISARPQLLAASQINVQLGPPADLVYSRDRSTFLNYSLTSQSGHHPTLFAESGTSIAGNLLLNSISRAARGDFVRLLSSYTLDDRQRLRRWTIGDANANSDLLGGSALIGGVTVARNFNLDPYFVRYPPLDLRGTALTPSRVEVYVNGALVSQQDVPPGPFELRNIPVSSGSGNARIVVRDVFGRETVATSPFYYSTGVLERGLSEYVYSAGLVRNNFGTRSFDYDQPALLSFHRYGFTDNLTAGGRFEASRDLISGGPTSSWRTRVGEIDLALAFSEDHSHSGQAATLGYQYLARHVSFGGFARAFSREYANLSLRREADRPLRDTNIFATLLTNIASFTLLWNDSHMRDSLSTSRIALLTNIPFSRRASFFLSVGSGNEGSGRRAELFSGLSIYLGGSTAASATVDHRDGRTQTVTEIARTLPVGTGFGYRLQSIAADGTHTGSGAVQYQTDFGRYEVDFDPFHTSVRPTVTAAGGLVYEGGSILPARPVEDSFALIQVPGVKDVRVYSSNNLIGRTDNSGELLVPNLLSYYGNRLSIDDRDIPLNYEVQAVERTIAPPYRGGALVRFPVQAIRTVSGSVVVRTAKGDSVPAFGQLTLSAGGKDHVSPLGRGGEFYFDNLASGTYEATIESHDGVCRFRMEIPAGGESMVKLGQQTCSNEAAKP